MPHSRFYLSDLQVHTPADHQHRYGNAGGREPNEAFARQLMRAHADAGVEVVAVTDHNRVDWYPVLSATGLDVGVIVFPGMEFSVNGCHLLAIWDATDDGYAMATRLRNQLFAPGVEPLTNAGPRVVAEGQVLEWAEKVVEHRGLVFAPHSTQKKIGLFGAGVCSNSPEVAKSELLCGFDVRGNRTADVLTNPRSEFGDVPPRWFISGDTRSLDDVGVAAVYLKLGATPTLEGIRQAFLAPETRIRFPSSLRGEWGNTKGIKLIENPAPNWPRLTAVKVDGGFHDQLATDLASGLNAIIGGKGTGKSALIEILRHVLESPASKSGELRQNRARNFPANADAVVGFVETGGQAYEARRSGGTATSRLFSASIPSDVRVSRRISVRVFGQRELQTLVDDPAELRSFIATQAGPDWSEAVAEEESLLGDLEATSKELGEIERDLAKLEEQQEEFVDLRERLDRATAKGVEELIAQSEQLERVDRTIRLATSWPTRVSEATENLRALLPHPQLPPQPGPSEAMSRTLDELEGAVESAATVLDKAIAKVAQDLPAEQARWEADKEDARTTLERALADAGIDNPQAMAIAQKRVTALEEAIAGLPGKRARSQELADHRQDLLGRMGETRRRKSRLVEEAARRLNEEIGPRVRLNVFPLGDRTAVEEALERALQGQSVRSEQLHRLARHDPTEFVVAARTSVDAVVALGVSATTATKVANLSASVLRELEESDVPDRVQLQINLGSTTNEDWQPINELSPGQRATALLSLALAAGEEPLIIDQPEDDLDNRYIFAEVVKVLARVCEHRQVIVATHNANIPVLGDAELVIAFDAAADRSSVLASGGLEDPLVAEQARQILEGGDEAFRARQRRYLAAR